MLASLFAQFKTCPDSGVKYLIYTHRAENELLPASVFLNSAKRRDFHLLQRVLNRQANSLYSPRTENYYFHDHEGNTTLEMGSTTE